MKLEDLFTAEELALIDSGNYKPGRAALDAKLDFAFALEREACAKVCEKQEDYGPLCDTPEDCVEAIRARGNT